MTVPSLCGEGIRWALPLRHDVSAERVREARSAQAEELRRGKLLSTAPVGMGMSDATLVRIATSRGITRGIAKTVSRGARWEVDSPRREVVADLIDTHVSSGGFVPTTLMRQIDGMPSSVQFFVSDRSGQTLLSHFEWSRLQRRLPISRVQAEQIRAFDYFMGNRDRHQGNLLLERDGNENKCWAIDNGLSLPKGPVTDFRWPKDGFEDHQGPLLDSTIRFIQNISPGAAALLMADAGIEPVAITHALRRLARMKLDPSFLEVPTNWAANSDGSRGWARLRATAALPTQGLDQPTLRQIDELVGKVSRMQDSRNGWLV